MWHAYVNTYVFAYGLARALAMQRKQRKRKLCMLTMVCHAYHALPRLPCFATLASIARPGARPYANTYVFTYGLAMEDSVANQHTLPCVVPPW